MLAGLRRFDYPLKVKSSWQWDVDSVDIIASQERIVTFDGFSAASEQMVVCDPLCGLVFVTRRLRYAAGGGSERRDGWRRRSDTTHHRDDTGVLREQHASRILPRDVRAAHDPPSADRALHPVPGRCALAGPRSGGLLQAVNVPADTLGTSISYHGIPWIQDRHSSASAIRSSTSPPAARAPPAGRPHGARRTHARTYSRTPTRRAARRPTTARRGTPRQAGAAPSSGSMSAGVLVVRGRDRRTSWMATL